MSRAARESCSIVAPWRLHPMACPHIPTPAAARESCSIVAPWRLRPMACPHVARFVGTQLDQCVHIMQKHIYHIKQTAQVPPAFLSRLVPVAVAELWPSRGRRRAVAVAVAVARPWLYPSRGRGRGRAVAVAVALSQHVLLHPPTQKREGPTCSQHILLNLIIYITVGILGPRCLKSIQLRVALVKGSLWLCSFNVGSQLQRLF